MNGIEHYDDAQEILADARREAAANGWGDPSGSLANQLAAAQVHSALAIATFFAPADLPEGEPAETAEPLPDGLGAIVAERARQRYLLGYTTAHDKRHNVRDFVGAAVHLLGGNTPYTPSFRCDPADPGSGMYARDDLVRAGALIAAALDRMGPVMGDD